MLSDDDSIFRLAGQAIKARFGPARDKAAGDQPIEVMVVELKKAE